MAPQPQPPNPGGYSPEILAWLMGIGPNPLEGPGSYQTPIMPPSNPEDMGTMDFQNDVSTFQKKANDIYSDPAFLAQLGGTTGGVSPDQFEQFATYEPVKAPGYMMMQNYLNSGDPISKFIASVISGDYTGTPGTANQAETELRKIYGDPAHPMYGVIQPAVLTYTDMGEEQPDWKRIRDIATGLETAVINDPQFNALDPNTNMPSQMTYNDTEIAKYFKEQGLPNPYEQYSPDLLAGRDTLSREGYNANKLQESLSGASTAKDDYMRFLAKNDPRNNAKPNMVSSSPLANEAAAATGLDRLDGQQFNDAANQWMADGGPNVPGGTGQSGSTLPRQAPQAQPRSQQSPGLMDQALRQGARGGQQEAYVKKILAQKELVKYANRSRDDRLAQLERERMMQLLAKQGHTPFNDVNRARQAGIYGA